jgi:GT2 family glycosyltransferase
VSPRDAPELCVVIPTYRRRASVRRALNALGRQTLQPRLFEVVVAIDGSDDGTREMLLDLRIPYRLRYAWQNNRGRAAACNLGASLSNARLLLFLDDDMEPAPRCLEAHLHAHSVGAPLGVIGAAPVVMDRGMSPAAIYVAKKFNSHLERLGKAEHVLSLRDFYTGNFSIRRSDFLTVRGFDEDFGEYGNEDLELSIRLRRTGLHIAFSPEALALQHQTKNFAQIAQDAICKGRTAVLLANKHPSALADLRLSSYAAAPAKWRLARSALLSGSAKWASLPRLIIRSVERLERLFARLPDRIYRLTLDYFYWIGALEMLRENRTRGRGLAVLPIGH